MNNNPLVLTLDFGTQSLRACLVDDKGEIVDIVKKPYVPIYVSEKKGYAEQDADFYWECGLSAMKELCQRNQNELKKIIGATITTFRDTAVLLDKNNFEEAEKLLDAIIEGKEAISNTTYLRARCQKIYIKIMKLTKIYYVSFYKFH